MRIPRLGVNIDHVATLRNARGGIHPDPVDAALLAIENGADGITAHLREDRRHITDDDLQRLQILCLEKNIPLNMEMAAVEEMAEIALALKPHAVCIVPENREERTTEGGLDVVGIHNSLVPIITQLSENNSRISLFIEANPKQIEASASVNADIVEFHTGAYAHALDDGNTLLANTILKQLQDGAKQASELGLEVHYGHGLTYENVEAIAAIPEAMELNIGHFIIGEALFTGLPAALLRMRTHMAAARGILL
ncbi:MAG: pyridoxine 5'-phosphate synthase [Robiginitomaculum sp.]|nr:MAG: pyridoxine 5'-phosphate synthase [Robiginitomaculum sp.]